MVRLTTSSYCLSLLGDVADNIHDHMVVNVVSHVSGTRKHGRVYLRLRGVVGLGYLVGEGGCQSDAINMLSTEAQSFGRTISGVTILCLYHILVYAVPCFPHDANG